MNTVIIKTVLAQADLRHVHKYRNRYRSRLGTGEGVLLINSAENKCRFIDSAGGIHNYYADPGDVFDVAAINGKMAAIGLRLHLSKPRRAGKLKRAA